MQIEFKTISGAPATVELAVGSGQVVIRHLAVAGKIQARDGFARVQKRSGLPMGGTHTLGKVVLDGANAEKLERAIRDFAASQPEIQRSQLQRERAHLARQIQAWQQSAEDLRSDAWERADDQAAVSWNSDDTEAAKLQAQLAEFDAEHPEIAEEEKQRMSDDAVKNIWR